MFFGMKNKKNFKYLRASDGVSANLLLRRKNYVRRTFLFSSLPGSLTLEAALVIPLYIFFILSFLYVLTVIHIQNVFQNAMEEAARSFNTYAYAASAALKKDSSSYDTALKSAAYIHMKNAFGKDTVRELADNSYIKGGYNGIKFMPGDNLSDKNIDFNILYYINLPFFSENVMNIKVHQRCYFYPFTGCDITDEKGDYTQYVYVTATGTVYHTSPYCTYLNHYYNIVTEEDKNITWSNASNYSPCSHCAYNQPIGPTSFLCTGSKVYHNRTDCIYIERMVYKVPLDSINLPICSRCQKGVSK